MTTSEARRRANAKWDKENMVTFSCRITKRKAEDFRQACLTLDTLPSRVLQAAINDTIERANNKEDQG